MAGGVRVACLICRENQLHKECCRGGLLPRPAGLGGILPDGEEEEEDRISALTDDILLRILARAAAHTSLLASRWRGLWTRLPALKFHCIAPGPLDAALALVDRPAPSLLDIQFTSHHEFEPARVSSLLGAAAALAPAELVVDVTWGILRGPVELPCFERTTSIRLNLYFVGFTLPPAGGFPALESFEIENGHIDLSDLLPRCPRLRKLLIPFWNSGSVMVRSSSLEEFIVQANFNIEQLEIVAPALKRLYLYANRGINEDFSVVFSAPALEDLTWKCECKALSYQFGVIWRMWSLTFARTPLANDGQSIYSPRVGVLTLNLETNVFSGDASKTFEQEISRFQVTDYSVLELDLIQQGHVYGAIVLHLLGLCTSVQRLKVTLDEFIMDAMEIAVVIILIIGEVKSISLLDLKEVEIQRFRGADHEFDLLKALLRCATVLETVTLGFSRKVSSSDSGCMKIVGILKDYPSVKCSIYQYGKRIFTHE